jgi:pyrroloquinoline quinone biosynthesis protein D
MSDPAAIDEASVPRLRRGVRLRLDPRRDAWVLLAPERVLVPDETAIEILRRCDGAATVGAIVDDLSRTFEAERDVIAVDVVAMLRDLAEKGMIEA